MGSVLRGSLLQERSGYKVGVFGEASTFGRRRTRGAGENVVEKAGGARKVGLPGETFEVFKLSGKCFWALRGTRMGSP